ncbi:MAG: hypothetical protein WEC34_00450 [Acidimicrobiia bacterium]
MRGFIAGLLVLVGLFLVPFADLGIWTQRQILPTDEFTDMAAEILDQDPVQAALVTRLVDELVAREPRLALGRVVIDPAMRQVIDTPQFEAVFRTAVGGMHAQLMRGDDQLSLNLDAMLPILEDLVAQVNQGVADQIPDAVGLPDIVVVRKDQVPQLWFGVDVTREASWVFPVLMLLAFAAAIVVASKRALTLVVIGFGSAFVCLLVILALRTGRDMLSNVAGDAVNVDAFDAGYGVITDLLVNQTLVFGVVGIVAAGVGVVLMVVDTSTRRPHGGRGRSGRARPGRPDEPSGV